MDLDVCSFAPLTEDLHSRLSGFDCQKEPDIEEFFKQECILNDHQLLSKTYCFYLADTMEAVAGFCVLCSDISISYIPKKIRNKLNRKIPYVKQRDQYPAVLIGQFAVFDKFAGYHLGDELMNHVKYWLLTEAQHVAARYIVVDAVNNSHVISYYERNQFSLVFPSEKDEAEALGLAADESLKTRFMLCDLKPTYDMLRDSATFEI